MQIDMHYYGTYCMARAAGLREEAAEAIARAAQYVDDNAATSDSLFGGEAHFHGEPTAHHPINRANLDEADQRQVWVPFHFLPGAAGDHYLEKLRCVTDSAPAREAVDNALSRADRPYAAELMGVVAHVYADTFSHYGFSGVSSPLNKIIDDSIDLGDLDAGIRSYIEGKFASFAQRYSAGRLKDALMAFGADALGALGHGSVGTYPDRPYLKWSFRYETGGNAVTRDNPATFLAGAEALHAMFRRFAEARPDLSDHSGRDWPAIADRVAAILAVQADCDGRIAAWQKAARAGDLFPAGAIPVYDHRTMTVPTSGHWRDALATPGMRFFQAAAQHRVHVLRDLLPSHGLLVS